MATKKDPAAVALGKKGGKARAKKLTPEQLSEQGRKAISARWQKAKKAAAAKKRPAKKGKR